MTSVSVLVATGVNGEGFLISVSEVFPDTKGVSETLTYLDYPHKHWRNIRTNNILELLSRKMQG